MIYWNLYKCIKCVKSINLFRHICCIMNSYFIQTLLFCWVFTQIEWNILFYQTIFLRTSGVFLPDVWVIPKTRFMTFQLIHNFALMKTIYFFQAAYDPALFFYRFNDFKIMLYIGLFLSASFSWKKNFCPSLNQVEF